MTRALVILTVLTAVALSACIVGAWNGRPKTYDGEWTEDEKVAEATELHCLATLKAAEPLWVSLESLAHTTFTTPGTVALALAGHPSVEMKQLGTRRYYRVKY